MSNTLTDICLACGQRLVTNDDYGMSTVLLDASDWFGVPEDFCGECGHAVEAGLAGRGRPDSATNRDQTVEDPLDENAK